ncbi:MAG: flagellar biosynthesis protein FlhF [Lachnospiraceae bacterium]|nr:flagellar biosynthesis protein FlhF [Lachnospiraceae bacterium]
MLIKKFEAPTEAEALAKAQAELGKDAMITHKKEIKPRGIFKLFRKASVELTASVDNDTDYAKRPLPPLNTQVNYTRPVNQRPQGGFSAVAPREDDKVFPIEQLLDGIQNMQKNNAQTPGTARNNTNDRKETKEKDTVKTQETQEDSASMACIKMIYEKLVQNEVEEEYANKLISEIDQTLRPDSDMKSILSNIYQKLILKLGEPKTLTIEEGKVKYVFFIGPTGVGKTTTIAKIASSLKLSMKANIALFAADTYRLAAVDQLQKYADILSVPLRVIYEYTDMKQAVSDFSHYDIVLVDTAGRSHKDKKQTDDIEKLINTVPKENREVYLVLSAATKYKDLVRITEAYSEIAEYNLIFTKLDETECIGNIFNIKMLTDAPLSYATDGQNVPDDISKINPQSVAKQLLGGGN